MSESTRIQNGISGSFSALELTWLALKPNIRWLAVFGLITHPLYLIINNAIGNGADSASLRFFAVIACLAAIALPRVERALGSRFSSIVAVLLVFFTLPFFFLWILVENSLTEGLGVTELASRQMQCAFAMMATALLIYDRAVLAVGILFCVASVMLLALLFLDLGPASFSMFSSGVLSQIPFWLFGLTAGSYFNRNRAVVEREKFKTLHDTGGYLAHELRTPLAGVSFKLHGLNRLLERLPKELDSAASTEDLLTELELHRASIRGLSEGAISDVVYANSLIDMFLVRAGITSSASEVSRKFYASECVKEALERYPFATNMEKGYTRLEVEEDFLVIGPFVLMTHVILNLLKNALTYVHSSSAPEVGLLVTQEKGIGVIEVTDNGRGIALEDQERIFESFYTTSLAREGAGIGLKFCRTVVEELGGAISVTSEPEVKTVFRIRLISAPQEPVSRVD